MTHDIYIVKTRTNKHKQTDILLYVNDGCGLDNCYSIKCNQQQEKLSVSRAKIGTSLGGVDKIRIGPDWTGSRIGSPYKDRLNRSQKSKVVYKASFWECDAFYIGKTKRRLHDRRIEHFKALTQVGHASAVVSHAISTGQNIKWDHFEVLASGRCDLHCKIKEPVKLVSCHRY